MNENAASNDLSMESESLCRMNRVLRHRLRNVASGIKSTVTFLSREFEDRLVPSEREYFPLIVNECDALNELTQRMSLLFDPPAPGESAPVESVLARAVERLHRRFPTARIEMQTGGPSGTIDRAEHAGIVLNEMLVNAVEAHPNGRIGVSVTRQGGRLAVRVEDEGPRVEDEAFAQMFAPFFTTKARHLGLGLAICRRLAERMGGSVEASRNGEIGLRFTFGVPTLDDVSAP